MTVTILLIGVRFSVRLNIRSRAKSLTAAWTPPGHALAGRLVGRQSLIPKNANPPQGGDAKPRIRCAHPYRKVGVSVNLTAGLPKD